MKKINKIFVLVVLICSFTFNIDNCICQWQQTSGPQGSVILSFYSTGKSTVFAGSLGDGVFRSNNLGAKWQSVNTGLPEGNPRYDYAFTSNGSYLFVGTQDGVYRSSSNGNSWEPANTGIENFIVFGLTNRSVSGTNYLFAGTSDGVFKSSNNGNSWASTGLNFWINALTFKIKNGISLFAVASSYNGVFRSDDYGATWINVNNNLPPVMVIKDIIAVDKNIFIGTYDNGIFLSTNNGVTWSPVNTGLPEIFDFNVTSFTYFNNSLYAGTSNGIYKSNNLGGNWFAINNGFNDSYVNKLYSFAYNFFAGTQGWIYASFNEGKNWEPVNDGLPYTSVTCMAAKKNILFTGTESSGVSYSDDNGNTWYPINKESKKSILMLGIKGNTIFKGASEGGLNRAIYRSTNNGKNWVESYYFRGGLSSSFVSNSFYLYVIGSTAHFGAGFIIRSSDDGLTWDEVYSMGSHRGIPAMAINSATVFAGTSNGTVIKSTNNGDDWNEVFSFSGSDIITSLALKGTTIFAGTSENGIFRSTDNGNTWNQFNNGLTDTSIIALVYTTNENRVFAATPTGMFYTTINGTKWYKTNASFAGENITSLATDNDFIYAGLYYNGGVWKYSLAKMNGPVFALTNETPLTFSLSQNYPNPFNPVTNIKFEIVKLSDVKITVYNVLGREVKTLVNEQLQPGEYEVTFDGSNLASGLYFYKLIAGNFIETKKMLMIK